MKSLASLPDADAPGRLRRAFRPREFFVQSGVSLKRFAVGTRLQVTAAAVGAALMGWTGYATVHMMSGTGDVGEMQARVAQMQQDVEEIRAAAGERAAQLEQRQVALARMMADDADPQEVARLLPAELTPTDNPQAAEVSQAFNTVAGMQSVMVDQAQMIANGRIVRAQAMVQRVGLDPRRFGLGQGGVGGPFVPATAADADPRYLELFSTWRRLEAAERGVASIPSIMPVQGIRFTSGFGTRSDPFQSRTAMHAGIDLAGPIGTPIRATADATVGRAGVSSGYGNLIELDHGAGIATRYGHLSRILVSAGEQVRRGQVIGLMGSTGRSTGSHLHYEVRLDGRAVNPLPFLQTGVALANTAGGGGQGGPAGR